MTQILSSIVVCVPRTKQAEIEAEERDVAQREAAGETGIEYYWEMGRLPKRDPDLIYFLWDGAVRSYYEVTHVDRVAGRIYMKTTEHKLPAPTAMAPFRGFRYFPS